jgi:hypothetical protein
VGVSWLPWRWADGRPTSTVETGKDMIRKFVLMPPGNDVELIISVRDIITVQVAR